MTSENNRKSKGVNKSVIQSVTNVNEVLEKYGERAKLHEIDFSQLLSLLECCKNCLAITSGPSCLLSQTGKCIMKHKFNVDMMHMKEKIQTKYSKNHNILLVSTVDILSENKLGKSLHFFDRQGALIHRIFIYSYENMALFENILSKLKTIDTGKSSYQHGTNFLSEEVIQKSKINFKRDWFSLSLNDHINTMIDYGATSRYYILNDLPTNCSRKFSFDYLIKLIHLMHDTEIPLLKFSIRPGLAQASEDQVRSIVPLSSITMLYGENSCFGLDQRKIKTCRVSRIKSRDTYRSIIEIFDANKAIVSVFLCGANCEESKRDLWEQVIDNFPLYH